MRVLVINSGSSSIKYRLLIGPALTEAAGGLLERVGGPTARLSQRWMMADRTSAEHVETSAVADHEQGLKLVLESLAGHVPGGAEVDVVAHRVVHGGEHYSDAVLIDDDVVECLRSIIPLAPLHNGANLAGIEVARALRPKVPQVAVFDTAFHQTMPPRAYLYAVPRTWYERHRVRRYGFHGSSVRFVTARAARLLGKPVDTVSLIVLHLGNGASATAVRNGRSVDTSMGLTPLEGLVMGTRSGDLDPSIPFYMMAATGMAAGDLEAALNRQSGLQGLAGVHDMRDVLARRAAGDPHAMEAFDLYCYRLRKYIGAYLAVLGKGDAVVFTGGVGENQPAVRAACLDGLGALGLSIDARANDEAVGCEASIAPSEAELSVLVIPTNEELQIAREALAVMGVSAVDAGHSGDAPL